MKCLTILAVFSLGLATLSAQSPYHRPPGMPENELVAFDDYKSPQETATLQALFAIISYRWMLQIPEDARSVTAAISEIDTQSEKVREVARLSFDAFPADPSKRATRARFFPVTLSLMPEDTSSDEPWRTSRRFIALLEVPDLDIALRRSCANPLQRSTGALSIFRTTRLATPIKTRPGMWDGFGTAFDIMAHGEGDRYLLRVTFSTSL